MSLTKDGCFNYKENEIIEMKNSNFEKLKITEIEIDEINHIGRGHHLSFCAFRTSIMSFMVTW